MLGNVVFQDTDLFNDAGDKTNQKNAAVVHIRIQQRNGRKSLTTCAGLPEDLDLKKILRALKKTFSTNGALLEDEDGNKVIQLQGDMRQNMLDFLTKTQICLKDEIKVHGF